ncbi:DUF1028 domain-containing protein [Streptomyces sp. NPDC060065]|uniref:DUF1028 domain-containing protein n=1 Tax=Streptomyces sp. NPDC060065 TaxID=3347050 RepID=UPI003683B780
MAPRTRRRGGMSFTVLGLCPRTGRVGYATAAEDPTAGWRVATAVAARGVVAVEAEPDPRKLALAAQLLAAGYGPTRILRDLSDDDPSLQRRQIAILNVHGRHAVLIGNEVTPSSDSVVAADHIALGHGLNSEDVLQAASKAFVASEADDLENRLLLALEAGRDVEPQRREMIASALFVHDLSGVPVVDLRVDVHDVAIAELRRMFDLYRPHLAGAPLIQVPDHKESVDVPDELAGFPRSMT